MFVFALIESRANKHIVTGALLFEAIESLTVFSPQTPVFMSGHYGTDALPKLNAALGILDAYLAETKWLAGPEVTLADVVVVVTVSNLEVGAAAPGYARICVYKSDLRKRADFVRRTGEPLPRIERGTYFLRSRALFVNKSPKISNRVRDVYSTVTASSTYGY